MGGEGRAESAAKGASALLLQHDRIIRTATTSIKDLFGSLACADLV